MTVRVAINGYGTIGKRVADAVALQDDMEVVGVAKRRPTFEYRTARQRGYPFYTVTEENRAEFEKRAFEVVGLLGDMLAAADIVVDCTPGDVGAENKPLYEAAGVPAIFQGGEDADLVECSFNALANYQDSWGKRFVRVVSCNTTGLARTLFPLHRDVGIENVLAVMVRRAVDPGDSKKGPVNAIQPSLKLPTHHGPDVKTVIKGLPISTMAVVVPTTLMHLHAVVVDLKRDVSAADVIDLWERTPRIRLFSDKEEVKSTAQVMEVARDLGRSRADLFEIAVWREGVKVEGRRLYYYQAVHQESDVIPENVDAIRSMLRLEPDAAKSIAKTDAAMGIPAPRK
jgi:glyceraldehyde-3-phosphate dehydrogenase (NAD(P))